MKNNRIAILIVSILIITGFIMLNPSNSIDKTIMKFILNDSVVFNTFFYYITFLGSRTVLIPFVLIASLYLYFINKKIQPSVVLMGGTLLSYLLNQLIKGIIKRDRPSLLEAVHAVGYSFPSGHAMISTVCYGLFAYYLLKNIKTKKMKQFIIILFTSLIAMIGFSRVALNVHYFTDVIGGFLIGGLFILIYLNIIKRIFSE